MATQITTADSAIRDQKVTSGHDDALRKVLAELVTVAREHGPDSSEVRALVQKNQAIPEFKELAAALLLVMHDS